MQAALHAHHEQLQDWRLRITRYEQRTGRVLEDDIKVSVLLRNAPENTRRQLQLQRSLGWMTKVD